MYFHYDKKTGEYLFFSENPEETDTTAYTQDPTDYETNAQGDIVFIPFRVNNSWIMKPRFIINQF